MKNPDEKPFRALLKKEIAGKAATAIIGAFGLLAIQVTPACSAAFALLDAKLTPTQRMSAVGLALGGCIVSWVWLWLVVRERKKPLTEKHKFLAELGCFEDRKTGHKLCGKCLLGDGIEAPMREETTEEMVFYQCPKCGVMPKGRKRVLV